MASAERSPLASSVEKTNGSKLSRLLIDGGTRVLRGLFDTYHPPSHLKESLNSHRSTLRELLERKILNNFQWYKLFPAGEAIPDSKNFDISLLFLLLTSICGLSPPGGEEQWNKTPHPRDHSHEANLLRIKFFRNELYGHVTTTGIDTPKFKAYWRKISGALRGLGLHKAEIDRLKLEHCGEKDYIDVLCAWSASEQDIKLQLEDIRQSQTEILQSVEELHRTVVQDSKKKSEEVHQVQTKTQQTVDEVRQNVKDIYLYFEEQISHLLQSEHRENILQALVQKSEGDTLYAQSLVDFLKKKVSLENSLPSGILSVYKSYFKRPVIELCNEFKDTDDQFLNFLHALAAAREPLPLGFVSKLLLRVKSTSVIQGKVNAAIVCVSALLPVQDKYIDFFHKLVKDWLTEQLRDRRALFIEKGHEVLSKLCIDELEELKRNVVDCAQFSDTSKYALRHGVQHMLQPEERVCSLEEIVKTFVLDVELVYAKLRVNLTAASEDIVCVQKQRDKMTLSEKYDRALNALLILLRKHSNALEELPHTIFQTLLNEGGTEFSLEASRLLETKYSEVAHMKYVYKEDLQEGVQSKFHCANAVICFDVSSQLDYMACQCEDYTIELWSLHTGKLLWKREISKMKYDVFYECRPYSIPQYYLRRYRNGRQFEPLKSLYRSVVFHPTQDPVLPGILSHAFTFDGDLKPLFFSSECRFWVCSISADKIKMLTDCPNDARSIVMWNLTDGSEINRFTWNADIMSFAWSPDGRLLAISDLSRCIGVLDVMDRFKTLSRVTLPEVCGMMKFSPDSPCLYCLAFTSTKWFALFQVNIENVCNSYHPLELESCSETGYLLGDPFCLPSERDSLPWTPQLAFVLNKQSVLRVSLGSHIIEILYVDKLTNNSPEDSNAVVEKVAFSLNGDTLYVVTKKSSNLRTLLAWDISSAKLIAEKSDFESGGCFLKRNLVTVRAGVLVQTSAGTLELWNFKLSECIRCWSDLGVIRAVIRLADERVACEVSAWKVENAWKVKSACEEESKVIILDTTMEGIVSTVTFRGVFIACNSKCHVITAYDEEFQMQHGNIVLWKMLQPFRACGFLQCNTFSPSEQYCVLAGFTGTGAALYVLYADSGKTFRKLCSCGDLVPSYLDCKFVSDEECVTSVNVGSTSCCLRLFNVKSGDLLSAIATQNEVHSLAAYPPKCLIAVDFKDSFKVLQVKLP